MLIEKYYCKEKYGKINKYRKEAILKFIGHNSKQIILDIGCSSGVLGEIIKQQQSAVVYGIDISVQAVKEAEKKIDKAFSLNLEEDFEKWPAEIKKIKFDKIILSEVLEHLFSPKKLLETIKNISNNSTEIIITVPNVLFWKNRLKILLGNFEYVSDGLMDRGHIHFFTWTSLKEILKESNYEVLDINNHIPTRGCKFLGKFFPGLFSFQFILKAKKR